jgi:hypothetical protein
MARHANSSPPPSSSPQRPNTRARTVAFENAKLLRTRSRTTDTVPQQQSPVKETSPAKKKTGATSYDAITRVGPPRGHKKSAPHHTANEATISTNHQRTGGSVSDAVGYVLLLLFSLLFSWDSTSRHPSHSLTLTSRRWLGIFLCSTSRRIQMSSLPEQSPIIVFSQP